MSHAPLSAPASLPATQPAPLSAQRRQPLSAPAQPAPTTGVLLINLGTPDAPTPQAARRFLAQFLSDPRVVELHPLLWQPMLHGLVLRTRPAQSAAKYKSIWMPEGSPLMVWTQRQASLLRGYLGQRGHAVQVRAAMRYGDPDIARELDTLVAQGCQRILILPLYPQYSGSTTGSVMDVIARWLQRTRVVPELRFIQGFARHQGYIRALAHLTREHWSQHGRPDHLVISFHGIPQRMVEQGDPYPDECRATARRLTHVLGLDAQDWSLAFQSRFGRAKWTAPATDDTLARLGRQRRGQRVHIICPGFTADCLETLEEIAIEGRATFQRAGGGDYQYIPCLNAHPAWITALTDLTIRHLQGWPTAAPASAT